jgi:hypothetical protein
LYSRIRDVDVKGKFLDLDEEYTTATLVFIASVDNGYKAFGEMIKSSKDYSVNQGAVRCE